MVRWSKHPAPEKIPPKRLYVEDVALFDHDGNLDLQLIDAINSFMRMPRNRGRILVVWSRNGYPEAKSAGRKAFDWTPHEYRDLAKGIPTDEDVVIYPNSTTWDGTGLHVYPARQFVVNVGAMKGGSSWKIKKKPQSPWE